MSARNEAAWLLHGARSLMTLSLALVVNTNLRAAELDGAQLFEQARCYICHDADKVLIGPPLKAIAARHAARKDVMSDVLARKIVQGGGGNWGWVPMVPNQSVSLAQARVLADWIMNLKP
jgi:cytochrome c551/c552